MENNAKMVSIIHTRGEVGKVADNLLKRDFTASKPFEKLTTDLKYVMIRYIYHR